MGNDDVFFSNTTQFCLTHAAFVIQYVDPVMNVFKLLWCLLNKFKVGVELFKLSVLNEFTFIPSRPSNGKAQ